MAATAIRSLGLFFLILGAAPAAERGCTSNNGFSLGEHPAKPSLGIRLFNLNVRPEFPMRTMEHLRIYLAETFRARLSKSGYFGSVSSLADDSDSTPDLTMVGAFTHASIGTSGFSLMQILTKQTFDVASSVNVVGGILKAGNKEPATTFECQMACCQSAVADLPAPLHTGVGKSELSIAAMADELEKVYSRMEKMRVRGK